MESPRDDWRMHRCHIALFRHMLKYLGPEWFADEAMKRRLDDSDNDSDITVTPPWT